MLSVVPFANDVASANDTPYGLAAGMGTEGIRRSIITSERPRVGTVWGQHLSRDRFHVTLWGLTVQWSRPREWAGHHPHICGRQACGSARRRSAEPVRHAMTTVNQS